MTGITFFQNTHPGPEARKKPNALKRVKFTLSSQEQRNTARIQKKYASTLALPQGDSVHLGWLEKEYRKLCQIEAKNSHDKFLIKQYKFSIQENFESHLKKILGEKQPEKKKPESRFTYWTKRAGYTLLLITGLTMDGIASFLGMQDILLLISGNIPSLILHGICSFFFLINSALFHKFDASLLRNVMNIKGEATLNYELDKKEIESTKQINEKLKIAKNKNLLDDSTFSIFNRLTTQFNNNIVEKKKDFQLPKMRLQHIITGFGAIIQLSTGYYLASLALQFFAAPLIATPLGWGLIGFGMFTYLCFFLAQRNMAVSQMRKEAIRIKAQLDAFEHIENTDDAGCEHKEAHDTHHINQKLFRKSPAKRATEPTHKEKGNDSQLVWMKLHRTQTTDHRDSEEKTLTRAFSAPTLSSV